MVTTASRHRLGLRLQSRRDHQLGDDLICFTDNRQRCEVRFRQLHIWSELRAHNCRSFANKPRMLLAGLPTLIDLVPGAGASSPSDFTNIKGNVFFAANNGTNGTELWKSNGNGSASGTFMVKDIRAGAPGSDPTQLLNLNGLLVFTANEGTSGVELWRSNGQVAGTVRVKDIRPGAGSSNPAYIASSATTLFFAASDGASGTELWTLSNPVAASIPPSFMRPPGSMNLRRPNFPSPQTPTAMLVSLESQATHSEQFFAKQLTFPRSVVPESPARFDIVLREPNRRNAPAATRLSSVPTIRLVDAPCAKQTVFATDAVFAEFGLPGGTEWLQLKARNT